MDEHLEALARTILKEVAAHVDGRVWSALLALANQKSALHRDASPTESHFIGAPAGVGPRVTFSYVARKGDAEVHLYLDTGRDGGDANKQIFAALQEKRPEIERDFGEPLEWEERPRACRIKKRIPLPALQDEVQWPEAHAAMVEAMIRLEQVLRPRLASLSPGGSRGA